MPTTTFTFYFNNQEFFQRLEQEGVHIVYDEEPFTCIPVFLETRLNDLITRVAKELLLDGDIEIYCQTDEFSSRRYYRYFSGGEEPFEGGDYD